MNVFSTAHAAQEAAAAVLANMQIYNSLAAMQWEIEVSPVALRGAGYSWLLKCGPIRLLAAPARNGQPGGYAAYLDGEIFDTVNAATPFTVLNALWSHWEAKARVANENVRQLRIAMVKEARNVTAG